MGKSVLNVGRISEGFVLDHIQAGKMRSVNVFLIIYKRKNLKMRNGILFFLMKFVRIKIQVNLSILLMN